MFLPGPIYVYILQVDVFFAHRVPHREMAHDSSFNCAYDMETFARKQAMHTRHTRTLRTLAGRPPAFGSAHTSHANNRRRGTRRDNFSREFLFRAFSSSYFPDKTYPMQGVGTEGQACLIYCFNGVLGTDNRSA